MEKPSINEVVFLQGKKCYLRPADKEADARNFQKWINDPEIRDYIMIFTPQTIGQEEDFIDRMSKSHTDVFLVICTTEHRPIGVIGLHSIDWKNRRAVTGTIIGEKEFWSQGYGSDAKMQLLHYAFNELGMHKICSSVYEYNERSIKYSLGCGYVKDGVHKDHVFKKGRFYDTVELAIFRESFEEKWLEYNK